MIETPKLYTKEEVQIFIRIALKDYSSLFKTIDEAFNKLGVKDNGNYKSPSLLS